MQNVRNAISICVLDLGLALNLVILIHVLGGIHVMGVFLTVSTFFYRLDSIQNLTENNYFNKEL
jgi:hypothetical protein